jgi:WD40 repeat protein
VRDLDEKGAVFIRGIYCLSRDVIAASEVWAVAISPDSELFAAATDACMIAIWDLRHGQAKYRRMTDRQDKHWLRAVSFCSSGRSLFFTSRHGVLNWRWKARFWSRDRLQVFCPKHEKGTSLVCASPDGRFLVTFGFDQVLSVWSLNEKALYRTFGQQKFIVNAIVFHQSTGSAICACSDGKVRTFDPHSGKIDIVFDGHEGQVIDLSLDANGEKLASVSLDGTLRLSTLTEGKELVSIQAAEGHFERVVASNNTGLVFTGGSDGVLRAWYGNTGTQAAAVNAHRGACCCLAISPNGRYLITGGRSDMNLICLWKVDGNS